MKQWLSVTGVRAVCDVPASHRSRHREPRSCQSRDGPPRPPRRYETGGHRGFQYGRGSRRCCARWRRRRNPACDKDDRRGVTKLRKRPSVAGEAEGARRTRVRRHRYGCQSAPPLEHTTLRRPAGCTVVVRAQACKTLRRIGADDCLVEAGPLAVLARALVESRHRGGQEGDEHQDPLACHVRVPRYQSSKRSSG